MSFKNNIYFLFPLPSKLHQPLKPGLFGVSRVPQSLSRSRLGEKGWQYLGRGLHGCWAVVLTATAPLRERAPGPGVTPGLETVPSHIGLHVARKAVARTLVLSVGTGATYRLRTMLRFLSQCSLGLPPPAPASLANTAPKERSGGSL